MNALTTELWTCVLIGRNHNFLLNIVHGTARNLYLLSSSMGV